MYEADKKSKKFKNTHYYFAFFVKEGTGTIFMNYVFENEDLDKKEELFRATMKKNSDFSNLPKPKPGIIDIKTINTIEFREELGSISY